MFKVKKIVLCAFAFSSVAALSGVATVCFADESLRDPTRPLGHVVTSNAGKENTLRVQSVLISDTRKIAYINGKPVREQEVIPGSGGIKVIRIETQGVVLQQNERRWRLGLDKVVIRQ